MKVLDTVVNFFTTKVNDDADPNIGNVYEDLKERVTNPLLFSYGVSFFFCNWRVWISLFFESEKTVLSKGFIGRVEYSLSLFSWQSVLFYPLLSALIYVFLFPIIRNYIKARNAKYIIEGNKEINKIAKTGTVPVEMILKLREDYVLLSQRASQAIANDQTDEYKAKLNELTITLEKYQQLNNRIEETTKKLSLKTYEGFWDIKVPGSNSNRVKIKITVDGNLFYIKNRPIKAPTNYDELVLTINFFTLNEKENVMIWHVKLKPLTHDVLSLNSSNFIMFRINASTELVQILMDGNERVWNKTSVG